MDSKHICIYHDKCADGFGAAYAVWKKLGDAGVEYIPASYGDEPPNVSGAIVIMVDFSYKRDALLAMAEAAESILVIDHHDTAEKELVDLPPNVQVVFDQNHSGAVLAWQYFHNEPAPRALKLIEDRDLWRFDYVETRDFSARLFCTAFEFAVWDRFVLFPEVVDAMVDEGALLEHKHNKDVNALVDEKYIVWLTNFPMPSGELVAVPAVNCPWMFASDVGHKLNEKFPAGCGFSATFMIRNDQVSFSLRSNGGAHCGDIAKQFGGGGHPGAAGFSLPMCKFADMLV